MEAESANDSQQQTQTEACDVQQSDAPIESQSEMTSEAHLGMCPEVPPDQPPIPTEPHPVPPPPPTEPHPDHQSPPPPPPPTEPHPHDNEEEGHHPLPPTPPSMHTSNQNSDGLDFDSDVGVSSQLVSEQEALTNGTDSSESEMQQDSEVMSDASSRKRKARDDENSCKRRKFTEDDIDEEGTLPQQRAGDNSIRPGISQKQEFEIIDDIGSEDEMIGDYDSELDEEEIEALLDQMLTSNQQGNSGSNEDDFAAPVEREKIVLKERGQDPFDILPEGWVTVTHNSGMPVYLHKMSRVCTLSRPYFLGPGSARKHDIPLSAVPCLEYRRELEKEKLQEEGSKEVQDGGIDGKAEDQEESSENGSIKKDGGDSKDGAAVQENEKKICPINKVVSQPGEPLLENGSGDQNPGVRVESLEKYNKDKTLGPLELRDYCEKLFEFQTIKIKKYKTWKDRRKHNKLLKHRPSLPSNTKLITCPILTDKKEDKPNRKKEFVLNPAGKSDICILHEYVQHAMRVQPRYVIKELENAQTPYSATVIISNVEYGSGYASSKKAAKNEAAKATLGILIPDLKKQAESNQDIHDLSFFDQVKIEDPRVHDLCNKAGQPGPFQILCECLRRNFGMGDTNCEMTMKTLKHQKSEFTMRVGKHSAQVICKNKREGKQLAAQAILQSLHPHIHNWGSLLRLYGIDWKAIKEKEEELSVTSLHAKAKQNQPNTAILNKLKEEMQKLQLRRGWLTQVLDLEVPVDVLEKKQKLLIIHQVAEDDARIDVNARGDQSTTFSKETELSLRRTLTMLGYIGLKAAVHVQPMETCPSCGPPIFLDCSEEKAVQVCIAEKPNIIHMETAVQACIKTEEKSIQVCVESRTEGKSVQACVEAHEKSIQVSIPAESEEKAIQVYTEDISVEKGVQVGLDEAKPPIQDANTQTSTMIHKVCHVQTDLCLDVKRDLPQQILLGFGKDNIPPRSTLSGLCECMNKIFVEQGSQCEPLPGLCLKSDDKGTQVPELQLHLQAPSLLAVQPVSSYLQAALPGLQQSYMMNVPPLMSQQPPPLLSLPTENRMMKNTTEPTGESKSVSEVQLPSQPSVQFSEGNAAPPEKPVLPSYQAYWRAVPSKYVPQDVLVKAGVVPPEKRCWRSTVPLPSSATLVRMDNEKPLLTSRTPTPTSVSTSSMRGRSPMKRKIPLVSPRPTQIEEYKTKNYPNTYLMQQKESHENRSMQFNPSPPGASKRISDIARNWNNSRDRGNTMRYWDKSARSQSPANQGLLQTPCQRPTPQPPPRQDHRMYPKPLYTDDHHAHSDEPPGTQNTTFPNQTVANTAVPPHVLFGRPPPPPPPPGPPPGPYNYPSYRPAWHWQ